MMIGILFLIFLLLNLLVCYKNYKILKLNKETQVRAQLLVKKAELIQIHKKEQQERINEEIKKLSSTRDHLLKDITHWEKENNILKQNGIKEAQQVINIYKQKATLEADKYIQSLQAQKDKEDLKFNNQKKQYQIQIENIKQDLDVLKATRAAAHEALLKEQQIKDNKEQYCLIPNENDLDDIYKLQRIKKDLHKPRILSMLIWQTYWQPLAKKQFPQILGTAATKTGIYKITNLKTNDCYIGQSLDIYKRWCQHCKCGLGIDTPVGNKLYKAMFQYGLQNFTFELLEECSKETLNEKEKFFIELYDAKNFGYNSTGGNK